VKLCFIADASSIHTRRWVEYFCKPSNEVHILSTAYCAKPVEGAIVHNLAAWGKGDAPIDGIGVRQDLYLSEPLLNQSWISKISHLIPRRVQESKLFRMAHLYYKVIRFKNKAKTIIKKLQPDIVHCLRLPVEGYIGGLVGYHPLVMSTWGEDMVYCAQKYFVCRCLTKKAMSKVGLYFSDSLRDKYIAEAYGFSPSNLTVIIPVTGGLKLEELPLYHKEPSAMRAARQKLGIAPEANLLISVRGFKDSYIDIEPLVKAIRQIIQVFPNTLFVLKGDTQSRAYFQLEKLAKHLRVGKYIRFTDRLNVEQLVDYFTASDIMVSVTLYDGLPISMLEGIAYGLIPCMSVHSPIQEWLSDGWNGYLFNPKDPEDIAETIVRVLKNKDSFEVMRERNWALLEERADYYKNMKIAEERYRKVAGVNDKPY
jgi:glycosyltransferase involved in cell wall biosynthesis